MTTNQKTNPIAKLLLTDDEFVLFALQLVYDEQTEYEQETRATVASNRRGFNVVDARKFTKIAEDAMERGYLEPDELSKCRKLNKRGLPVLAKYAGQIRSVYEAALTRIPRKPPTQEGSSGALGEEVI
jgi:hypothetical protein